MRGSGYLERAAEEISIDEPIDARHQHEVAAQPHRGDAYEPRRLQSSDLVGFRVNPLHEEPDAATIQAVRRFGVVGLVACALGAAVARWWKSRAR
jgi:hypothetical protein